jgi:hypothetical protein
MAGSNLPIYYWDACIFISLLNGETTPQRSQSDLDGIEEHVRLFDNDLIIIATSVISLIEVMSLKVIPEHKDTLKEITKKPNFLLFDVIQPMAEIANEIREYYQLQKDTDGIPTIETPDSIHLATAIYINQVMGRCPVFYTFDGAGASTSNKKRRTLISVGGQVANKYSMVVTPPTPAPSLFTSAYTDSISDEDDEI